MARSNSSPSSATLIICARCSRPTVSRLPTEVSYSSKRASAYARCSSERAVNGTGGFTMRTILSTSAYGAAREDQQKRQVEYMTRFPPSHKRLVEHLAIKHWVYRTCLPEEPVRKRGKRRYTIACLSNEDC